MIPTLYFLRSSENKIIQNMLEFAHPSSQDTSIYSDFYGLSSKDLGLYALVENKIAGAIWSRKLDQNEYATLSLAILPEFRNQGIASHMMQQFLLEAAACLEELQVDTYKEQNLINFYKKFGFTNKNETSILKIELIQEEVVRPSDGYDPRRWMD